MLTSEPVPALLPSGSLEAFVLAHARPVARRFSQGQLLVMAECEAGFVHLIRRGCVRVYRLTRTGAEATTALLGPGDVVGIAPLLGQPVHHSFAEAQTTVDAWAIPAAALRGALAREPLLWALLVAALGRRLAWAQAQMRDLALLPVPERVRNVRVRLAESFRGQPPRLTRVAMAAVVASRRETVSRALNAHPAPPRAADALVPHMP